MNSRFQGAMAAAMSRLKSSDIAGATAAIRQALAGGAPLDEGQPSSKHPQVDTGLAHQRRLGDVLRTLGAQRT